MSDDRSEYYTLVDPPPFVPPVEDEDHVYGTGWGAERTTEGYTLNYDNGAFAGKMVTVAISAAEFEQLRTRHDEVFQEITLRHELQDPPA